MLGRDLIPAKVVLAIKETTGGARFEAAKLEIGKAIIKPKTVATKAIFIVSTIPVHAIEQNSPISRSQTGYALGSKTDQSGGHRLSKKKVRKLSRPPFLSAQSPLKSTNVRYDIKIRKNEMPMMIFFLKSTPPQRHLQHLAQSVFYFLCARFYWQLFEQFLHDARPLRLQSYLPPAFA